MVSRSGRIAAFAFFAVGTVVLVNAAWLLEKLGAAPQAVQALTFDREFARFRGPLVLALMIAGLVHYLVVTIHGRWRPVTRHIEVALGFCTCAVLTWVLFAGPVYPSPDSDRTVKFSVAIIVAVSLIDLLLKAWRLLHQPAASLITPPPGSLRTSRPSS